MHFERPAGWGRSNPNCTNPYFRPYWTFGRRARSSIPEIFSGPISRLKGLRPVSRRARPQFEKGSGCARRQLVDFYDMDDKDRPPDFKDRGHRPGKKAKFTSPVKKDRKAIEFSEDVAAEVIRILRAGNCRDTAAASVGVLSDTFRKWLRWGAQGEAPYAQFVIDCRKAEADAEVDIIQGIRKSGYRQRLKTITTLEKNGKTETTTEVREEPGDARNLMWIAERRGARNWSLGIIERRSKEQAEARKAAKGTNVPIQVVVRMAEPGEPEDDANNPDPVQ
jgi:hypothetical protein